MGLVLYKNTAPAYAFFFWPEKGTETRHAANIHDARAVEDIFRPFWEISRSQAPEAERSPRNARGPSVADRHGHSSGASRSRVRHVGGFSPRPGLRGRARNRFVALRADHGERSARIL